MKKLTFKYVKQYFEDHDCELFETEYINAQTKMRYRCKCGNKDCKIKFNNFQQKQRCMECSGSKKLTFEFIKQYFEEHDCKLLATEYINNYTLMEYECECRNSDCKISFSNFKKGKRCMKCGIKKTSGKNNGNYNYNLTDEERDRKRYSKEDIKWRKDVYEKDKYTCQICGDNKGGNLNAHHIESYGDNKELRFILSNGITFCEEHHIEFHKKYGYGYNNKKQLEEFLSTINIKVD